MDDHDDPAAEARKAIEGIEKATEAFAEGRAVTKPRRFVRFALLGAIAAFAAAFGMSRLGSPGLGFAFFVLAVLLTIYCAWAAVSPAEHAD
ncbi:hypothetical protein [Phenylobacterium sp.]|uniref:hypothetical protein n=1 Tax=Phenylobacterium sp. TaxID=1871053 RepID=UPI003561BB7B